MRSLRVESLAVLKRRVDAEIACNVVGGGAPRSLSSYGDDEGCFCLFSAEKFGGV